jgi:hypothetical protein
MRMLLTSCAIHLCLASIVMAGCGCGNPGCSCGTTSVSYGASYGVSYGTSYGVSNRVYTPAADRRAARRAKRHSRFSYGVAPTVMYAAPVSYGYTTSVVGADCATPSTVVRSGCATPSNITIAPRDVPPPLPATP